MYKTESDKSNNFYYGTNYKTYFQRTVEIDSSGFLGEFAESLPEKAIVWDIGCGSGRDLFWLKKKGFKAVGLEKSPGLARLARRYSGCRVMLGDFEKFDFSSVQAHGILLIGVLVHLPRERFAHALSRIVKGLTENGLLYISLKQGDGKVVDSEGRVFYLWQDKAVRSIFSELALEVVFFSKNSSALKTGEAWLGYLLRRD